MTAPPKDSVYSEVLLSDPSDFACSLGSLMAWMLMLLMLAMPTLWPTLRRNSVSLLDLNLGISKVVYSSLSRLSMDLGLVEPDGMNSLLKLLWIWISTLVRPILMFG
jgi:hypothetical protein